MHVSLIPLALGLGLLGFIEPCTIGAHMLFLGAQRVRPMRERLGAVVIFVVARLIVMGGFGGLIVFLGQELIEFDALAGTFWYHPHQRSFEQVGRGLYGALIVEEATPPRVDRELLWVLDDWRLTQDAAIAGDFGGFHDMSHAGRLGNTVTINGRVPGAVPVRADERIRLRLINAANARIFALDFGDLAPQVIALDGQPDTPHAAPGGRVVFGPAMRADLMLDVTATPGATALTPFAAMAHYPGERIDEVMAEREPAFEATDLRVISSIRGTDAAGTPLELDNLQDLIVVVSFAPAGCGVPCDNQQAPLREVQERVTAAPMWEMYNGICSAAVSIGAKKAKIYGRIRCGCGGDGVRSAAAQEASDPKKVWHQITLVTTAEK